MSDFTPADVRVIADAMRKNGYVSLEYSDNKRSLRLRTANGKTNSSPVSASSGSGCVLRAPTFGLFRDSHPCVNEKLMSVGQTVAEGEIVGLLEIEGVYLPLSAPITGVISQIDAMVGDIVGFDQQLLIILPAATERG